jgi:hypothetical protein
MELTVLVQSEALITVVPVETSEKMAETQDTPVGVAGPA